jgi:hypothetical protein
MRFKLPPFRFTNEFFLLLLPVFFVLHGYTEYYPVVPAADAVKLLGSYLLATVVTALFSFLLFRSWKRAAVFSFLVMAYNFFFGALHDTLKKVVRVGFFTSYAFLIPLTFVLLIVAFLLVKNSKSPYVKVSRYLNWSLLLLILIDLMLLTGKSLKKQPQITPLMEAGLSKCDSCTKPDIYLILADEYAGKQELKDLMKFDNSNFEHQLEARGFKVLENTKSNYNFTPYSMSSMLNMQYLQPVAGNKITTEGINKCTNLINHSLFPAYLKTSGYTIKNFSIFDVQDIPTTAETRFLQNKIRLISSQTFVGRIDRDIRFNLVIRFRWESETRRFVLKERQEINQLYNNAIEEAAKAEHPKFVYTHLLMPHYPYFCDSLGRMYDVYKIFNDTKDTKAYLQYLEYCNKRFLYLIDQIIATSKQPPVIIFMSDHGFREFEKAVPQQYEFMNINAVYLPSKNYSGFYNGMSNVNELRTLLNSELHQHLPMLKDSTIYLKEF